MCGLFGWSLPGITSSDRAVLAAVLMSGNTSRGDDSWGYWSPDTVPVRGMGPLDRSVSAAQLAASETLVGHTRFATHGSVNLRNAHPFVYGYVTGAHNGAIWNASVLDAKYPMRNFQVDSEHLIAHIAERRDMRELTGYGSVAYTDSRAPGEVFLSRMAEGELSVAKVKGGGVVWASDDEHLIPACRMAGLRVTLCHVKESAVYVVQKGEILKTRERVNISRRAVVKVSSGVISGGTLAPARDDVYPAREGGYGEKEINSGWDEQWTRSRHGWRRTWYDADAKRSAREWRERQDAKNLSDDLEEGFGLLASGEE